MSKNVCIILKEIPTKKTIESSERGIVLQRYNKWYPYTSVNIYNKNEMKLIRCKNCEDVVRSNQFHNGENVIVANLEVNTHDEWLLVQR